MTSSLTNKEVDQLKMVKIESFFDGNFQTPKWLEKKISRRNALKSAAGATMVAAMPMRSWSADIDNKLNSAVQTDPWLTLDAVLAHLLPESPTGPSAKDIQATQYLYNVVFLQPTQEAEVTFIYNGVGWLNDFSQSQLQKNFFNLSFDEKETILRAVSNSTAGENWLSNLVSYIFEAMLTPPIYGGNPNGIGWQWLDHQAGFPLPQAGNRYYELPGQRANLMLNKVSTENAIPTTVVSHQLYTHQKIGTRKA